MTPSFAAPKKTLGPESFAMPHLSGVAGIVIISLKGRANLVVLFERHHFVNNSVYLNWDAVREIAANPSKMRTTIDVSSSSWVYQVDDYAVGLVLGLISKAMGKRLVEEREKLPVREIGEPMTARFYTLVDA